MIEKIQNRKFLYTANDLEWGLSGGGARHFTRIKLAEKNVFTVPEWCTDIMVAVTLVNPGGGTDFTVSQSRISFMADVGGLMRGGNANTSKNALKNYYRFYDRYTTTAPPCGTHLADGTGGVATALSFIGKNAASYSTTGNISTGSVSQSALYASDYWVSQYFQNGVFPATKAIDALPSRFILFIDTVYDKPITDFMTEGATYWNVDVFGIK